MKPCISCNHLLISFGVVVFIKSLFWPPTLYQAIIVPSTLRRISVTIFSWIYMNRIFSFRSPCLGISRLVLIIYTESSTHIVTWYFLSMSWLLTKSTLGFLSMQYLLWKPTLGFSFYVMSTKKVHIGSSFYAISTKKVNIGSSFYAISSKKSSLGVLSMPCLLRNCTLRVRSMPFLITRSTLGFSFYAIATKKSHIT